MKNDDKIADLLSEMLVKQDVFVSELQQVRKIQERQEKLLVKMLEILSDDIPKFDELLDIEYVKGKDQIILKKHK